MQSKVISISLGMLGLFYSGISIADTDTNAVLKCFQQSQQLEGANLTMAAILCSNVKSDSDIQSVTNCYKQAYPLPGSVEDDARLCANVKS